MMYLEHFGLREPPFRITPHTEFFFAGANRGATLEALIYAITHDEGIVKVSGEVGSGKTMLCRMLLEKLPENVETVYLANPMLSRDEILFAIADELHIPLPDERSHLLLRALQERLLSIYATGRQVVALIDEAHAMPPEALEEIRLLSNLESNHHKLLQIVLFGQPELDLRLGETAMRQLNDRITHHFRLEPLRRDDVGVYLMFRLRAAGYHGPDLFTKGAIQRISETSEGLTRRINILADKALLAAFSDGVHQIDCRQARAAIRDAQFKPLSRRFGSRWAVDRWGSGGCRCDRQRRLPGRQPPRRQRNAGSADERRRTGRRRRARDGGAGPGAGLRTGVGRHCRAGPVGCAGGQRRRRAASLACRTDCRDRRLAPTNPGQPLLHSVARHRRR
jgi:MSHA biogenesis protein MshM